MEDLCQRCLETGEPCWITEQAFKVTDNCAPRLQEEANGEALGEREEKQQRRGGHGDRARGIEDGRMRRRNGKQQHEYEVEEEDTWEKERDAEKGEEEGNGGVEIRMRRGLLYGYTL